MAKGLLREMGEAGLRALCKRYLTDLQDAYGRAEAAEKRAADMERTMVSLFHAQDSSPPPSSPVRSAAPATAPEQRPSANSATGPLPEEYTGELLTDAGDLHTAIHARPFHHFGLGGTVDAPYVRIFWLLNDGRQKEVGRWLLDDETRIVFNKMMAGA